MRISAAHNALNSLCKITREWQLRVAESCHTWMSHVTYEWHGIYAWFYLYVTRIIHMCDMTHSCITSLIHMCAMTHSHVCHDSFTCVPWPIHAYATRLIHNWYNTCICATTHSYAFHDSDGAKHALKPISDKTVAATYKVNLLKSQFTTNFTTNFTLKWSYKFTTNCIWWRRPIGCLIIIGTFPQKSPIISGSFAKNDPQLGYLRYKITSE